MSVLLEPLLMAAASNGLTRYPVCSNEPCHFTGIANTRFGYRAYGGSSLVLNVAIRFLGRSQSNCLL